MVIKLSEAKAKLSKLVDMVYHGEEVTITKNNLPVVDLVPHTPRGKRQLGTLKGQLDPDAFEGLDDEIEQMFYGSDS